MANSEIYEGLKRGVEKGQSLEKAMMSFYNSGYKKEDIEAAAGQLQADGLVPAQQQPQQPAPQPVTNAQVPQTQQPQPTQPLPTQKQPAFPSNQSQQQGILKPVVITPKPGQPQTPGTPQQTQLRAKPLTPFVSMQPVLKPKPMAAKPKKPVQQRVSIYEKPQNKVKSQAVFLFLIFVLFVLLGTLVGIFIFQPEVSEFMNNLFGV